MRLLPRHITVLQSARPRQGILLHPRRRIYSGSSIYWRFLGKLDYIAV